MTRNKPDKNQLDLLKEFSEAEKLSVPSMPEESAAGKAIREIYEKLVVAEQNKKRKEEDKLVSISLKNIRAEIEAEQSDKIKEAKETKEDKEPKEEKVAKNDEEAFKPGDEYYGRFNKFRKSK